MRHLILALLSLALQQGIAQTHTGLKSWSRQSNIYEVNLRQYTAEGTLLAFEKHLPRLRRMGVEILWFMPVTPIGIEGRKMSPSDLGSYYAVRDYKAVNPEFGTIADFRRMVDKAHRLGFKVITDWVANHTALDNPWAKAHPDFYMKDSAGRFISPFDWTDVIRLDYRNRVLRDSMIDAMRFWLRETGIDGFRCDVAELVPDDFWKECITALRNVKPVYMLAEGNTRGLHEAGFDETYHWNAMQFMSDLYAGKLSTQAFIDSLERHSTYYTADQHRLFFTTNHDENSWNGTEFEKYGNAYKTMAALCMTMYQSVPLVYSGQEIPNRKRLKFFVKDPLTWSSDSLGSFYRTLLRLRRSNPALAANASYKKVKVTGSTGVWAYLRRSGNRKVLVILNLSPQEQRFRLADTSVSGNPYNVLLYQCEPVSPKTEFNIEPWGFIVYDYTPRK